MTIGIYKITCLANGKVYIGSSKNCEFRCIQHKSKLKHARHPNPHLQNAYNLYGSECFLFEIIDTCELHERVERETYWIENHDSMNRLYGFNLRDPKQESHNPETAARISKANKGKKCGEEHHAFGLKRPDHVSQILLRFQMKYFNIVMVNKQGEELRFANTQEFSQHFNCKQNRFTELVTNQIRKSHRGYSVVSYTINQEYHAA